MWYGSRLLTADWAQLESGHRVKGHRVRDFGRVGSRIGPERSSTIKSSSCLCFKEFTGRARTGLKDTQVGLGHESQGQTRFQVWPIEIVLWCHCGGVTGSEIFSSGSKRGMTHEDILFRRCVGQRTEYSYTQLVWGDWGRVVLIQQVLAENCLLCMPQRTLLGTD